ncbi:hypothetical protein M409DRAFT_25526 [Zasmidium cellare ATCC 36951]|uniref:Serine protease n=1 Tax=Zasmidium cellare ATCC 36951 TaxID=1080233 RepID=A0A6A6CD99_ZASCE|nr:uncharacterized protein M409DRAFT_25526 [Zasmidium cellare ATCC 36951]KAF2164180.1 hypothetical protein M409DRAFT_25526 [Zasmidium cellare ATCC 36951]
MAAAMLISVAYSIPVEQRTNPSTTNLLGFDPDYVHVSSANDVAPQIVTQHAQTLHTLINPSHNLTAPSSRGTAHQRRTNGPDDRYEFTDQSDYPWRIVGKIQWSSGVFCSGSLIGPRHVLTAHHCVPTDGSSVTFSPGFDNGPGPVGSAQVTTAVTTEGCGDGDCVTKCDFAIMIIDQRLGDNLGYFGAVVPDTNHYNKEGYFETMGYPGDRDNGARPYRQDGNGIPNPGPHAQFTCDSTGPFYSDSDVAGGQSGSAFWDPNFNVWGALSLRIYGYPNNVEAAAWASGDALVNTVIGTRNDFA